MKRKNKTIRQITLLAVVLFALAIPGIAGNAEPAEQPSATSYLFAYFLKNGEDGLHLAWSNDGYRWKALNGAQSLLRPEVGESKLMRDPCLIRGTDGTFHLVWTTSWKGKTIGYASSKDLLHWSPQQAIPAMVHEPQTLNTWAPEIFFDAETQQYLVYWSSTIPGRFAATDGSGDGPNNHRIYCTTTRDFQTYTPTRLFFDPGFNCIDATIVPADGKYYLVFKNEIKNPVPEKNIWIASSQSAMGPYTDVTGPIKTEPQNWIEGPTAIKIGGEYRVYYDCYTKGRIGVAVSKDLKSWRDASAQMDNPPMRHGTILEVPGAVVSRLLEKR